MGKLAQLISMLTNLKTEKGQIYQNTTFKILISKCRQLKNDRMRRSLVYPTMTVLTPTSEKIPKLLGIDTFNVSDIEKIFVNFMLRN